MQPKALVNRCALLVAISALIYIASKYSGRSTSVSVVKEYVELPLKSSSLGNSESKESAPPGLKLDAKIWDPSSNSLPNEKQQQQQHQNADPALEEFVYDAKNMLKLKEYLKKHPSKLDVLDTPKKNKPSLKYLSRRFPRIMIVGFGKAGTRALFELLKMRPDLKGPVKERRFFSDHYDKGLWSYLYSLPEPTKGGMVIEKSPDYITDKPAPSHIVTSAERLGITVTELRFIVILRDPINRAMSEYLEWNVIRQTNGNKKLPPFHYMVMRKNKTIDDSQPFIRSSNYATYIRHWFNYFSKSQTCFVDGDRFISNPYLEVHLLEECLRLEPYFTPDHFVYEPERRFYCFKSTVNQTSPYCLSPSKGRRHPNIPTPALLALQRHFKSLDDELPPLVGRLMEWQGVE